ncbi:hypothetical protein ACN28I_09095 [Archangium gephyra]|uniref:hypothetical protein n=1 Tax=Archangium gephyra TaxID=48 RepID=UPI003B76EE3B
MKVRIRIDPSRELPKEAWYAPRQRWRADRLLDWLDENPPKDAWKVVAVTEAEISATKGNIVDWGIAGLGSLGGPSCVVSAHIYKKHSKTKEALLRRLGDMAVHEFGHTLGFPHCEEKGCVMADAKGKAISSADAKLGALLREVPRDAVHRGPRAGEVAARSSPGGRARSSGRSGTEWATLWRGPSSGSGGTLS